MNKKIIYQVPKKLLFGHSRSKALNATPRQWKMNLQRYSFIDSATKTKFTFLLTAKQISWINKQQRK